jgi:hypothetical protein
MDAHIRTPVPALCFMSPEGLRHSNIARAAPHHAATTCAPPHPLPRCLRLLGDAPQQVAMTGESLAATPDLLLKPPDKTFATCN